MSWGSTLALALSLGSDEGGGVAGAITLITSTSPSGTGTVTFSGISGAYTDLEVVIRGASSAAVGNVTVGLTFNNDSGTNYQSEVGQWTSTASLTSIGAVAAANIGIGILSAGSATNPGGFCRYRIYGYAGTTLNKSVECQSGMSISNATAGMFSRQGYGVWLSTAAISRLDIVLSSGNFVAGSLVSLYGIN